MVGAGCSSFFCLSLASRKVALGVSLFWIAFFLLLTHSYSSSSPSSSSSISSSSLFKSISGQSQTQTQTHGTEDDDLDVTLDSGLVHRFAYVQYATNRQYLCNALINVARLRSHRVAPDILVMVPRDFLVEQPDKPIGKLIAALRARNVKFHALDLSDARLQSVDVTYTYALQKLELFRLTQYRRIVYFDSDALVMKSLDHLFLAPDSIVSMPEAYYTPARTVANQDPTLSSALMVIRPSEELYEGLLEVTSRKGHAEYDMDVINTLVRTSAYRRRLGLLPWHKYMVLTGIFRDPSKYFHTGSRIPESPPEGQASNATSSLLRKDGDENGWWNARKVFDEAYYIHFSDWPIPKPWIDDKGATIQQHGPKCRDPGLDAKKKGDGDCEEVKVWREIYRLFRDEMRELCPSIDESD